MTTQKSAFLEEIGLSLTPRRVASYQAGPHSTPEDCLCTYLWDVALAESLLPTIHFLEVAYRNSLHSAVGNLIVQPLLGTKDWLVANAGILDPLDGPRVVRAKESLVSKKLPITEAHLVDELSFGFWTNFLDTRYDQKWPRIIKTVFPHATNAERKRSDIQPRMDRIRFLRNAIFHNHPIWHWPNLARIHGEMHTILSWVSTAAGRMAKQLDRFPAVYRTGSAAHLIQVQGLCGTHPQPVAAVDDYCI